MRRAVLRQWWGRARASRQAKSHAMGQWAAIARVKAARSEQQQEANRLYICRQSQAAPTGWLAG